MRTSPALLAVVLVACSPSASTEEHAPAPATAVVAVDATRVAADASIAAPPVAPAPGAATGRRVLRKGGTGETSLAPAVTPSGGARDVTCPDETTIAIEGVPGRTSLASAELADLAGHVELSDNRRRTQVGIPLGVLVAAGRADTVEVASCDGTAVRWKMTEAKNPKAEIVVVKTTHGALKVLERDASGELVTRVRHVQRIRVVRGSRRVTGR